MQIIIPSYIISFIQLFRYPITQLKKQMIQQSLKIFIIGTTAVGKTKLSIELCKALNGQIINSDSKQLYRHADIMTAKASQEEKENIPHHMLDCIQLNQDAFNRNKYFHRAKQCLDKIQSENENSQSSKSCVIVGGTNYYVETLLYDVPIKAQNQLQQQIEEKEQKIQNEQTIPNKKITKQQINNLNLKQKYQLLKEVDNVLARKLHHNDQVRINTFLTRYAQTNIPPSLNYKPYVHKLRHPNTILFWLRNSNKQQLRQLMSKRIVKMLKEGGLKQIIAIFQYSRVHKILNKGALQSIGYKQFQQFYEKCVLPMFTEEQLQQVQYQKIVEIVEAKMPNIDIYLDALDQNIQKKDYSQKIKENYLEILKNNIQTLQRNTVQYSKRQITWIKNRIFSRSNQDNRNHFFVLQLAGMGTLHHRFDTQIKDKALEIISTIKNQGYGTIKQSQIYFTDNKHENLEEWKKYECEICGVQANGKREWQEHLKSRKHRGYSSKKQKKQQKRLKKLLIKEHEKQLQYAQIDKKEEPKIEEQISQIKHEK